MIWLIEFRAKFGDGKWRVSTEDHSIFLSYEAARRRVIELEAVQGEDFEFQPKAYKRFRGKGVEY